MFKIFNILRLTAECLAFTRPTVEYVAVLQPTANPMKQGTIATSIPVILIGEYPSGV